jgi:hypothetical protein
LIADKKIMQQEPAFGGLPLSMRVQLRVATALQATFEVEIGLAMSNIVEDRHR